MTRWIAILDDSRSRVIWLHEQGLDYGYDVVHAVRVTTFLRELNYAVEVHGRPPSLIILDHDLGIGSFEDVDGNNGMDAARAVAALPWRGPVLVWSTNDERRAAMCSVLKEKHGEKSPPIEAIPFSRERLGDLASWLRRHLHDG